MTKFLLAKPWIKLKQINNKMTYYENATQYIDDFDINASIIDTKERNQMCELWEKYAYSKVYLMYWSYDPTSDKNYW